MIRKKAARKKTAGTAPEAGRDSAAGKRVRLRTEIMALRSLARELGERFLLRLDSRFVAVERALEAGPGGKENAFTDRDVSALARKISRLKFKPKKGRLRDITVLVKLLKSANGKLSERD